MTFRTTWAALFEDYGVGGKAVLNEGSYWISSAIRYVLNPSRVDGLSGSGDPGHDNPFWRMRFGPSYTMPGNYNNAPGSQPTLIQTPQVGAQDADAPAASTCVYGGRLLAWPESDEGALADWVSYADNGWPLVVRRTPFSPVAGSMYAFADYGNTHVTGDGTENATPVHWRDWLGSIHVDDPDTLPTGDLWIGDAVRQSPPKDDWDAIPAAAISEVNTVDGTSYSDGRQWVDGGTTRFTVDPANPARIVCAWSTVSYIPYIDEIIQPVPFRRFNDSDIPSMLPAFGSVAYAEDYVVGWSWSRDVAWATDATWTFDAGEVGTATEELYTSTGYVSQPEDIQPRYRPHLFVANGNNGTNQSLVLYRQTATGDRLFAWDDDNFLFEEGVRIRLYRRSVRLVEFDGHVIAEAYGSATLVATIQNGGGAIADIAALGAVAYDAAGIAITPDPAADDALAIVFPLDAQIPAGLWALEWRFDTLFSGRLWSDVKSFGDNLNNMDGALFGLTNPKLRNAPHGWPTSAGYCSGHLPTINLTKA